MAWLYTLVGRPVSAWISRHFDLDVHGADRLPASGPYVIASNHVSYLDPLALAQLVYTERDRQQVAFLAKRELFDKKSLGWFMRGCGQIPVDRQSAQASDSLRSARAALADDAIVVVFPEGTISLTLVPMRAYTGVARLAVETGVPVVPVGLWGTHRSMAKYRERAIVPHRPVTVEIGRPKIWSPSGGDVGEVAQRIMDDVVDCVDAARSRYPDVPGPDDWWGPPEWPRDRAGRWRPTLSPREARDLQPDEVLAEAHRAMLEGGDDGAD